MVRTKADECDFCGRCSAVCMRGVSAMDIMISLIKGNDSNNEGTAEFESAGAARCVQCGHCGVVCPKGIDVPSYILKARKSLKDNKEF